MTELSGKKVIVTGGGRGIGAAAVRALVSAGAIVQSIDHSENGGEVLAGVNEAGPGRARFHRCDVSSRPAVAEIFDRCVADMGGLDALVHVAGIHLEAAPQDITDDDWDRIINVNLRGTFITNQEAFRHLRNNGDSRIVNFGSMAGLVPYTLAGHYAASKGGVIAWSRTIAHAWGQYGIRVNVVNPAVSSPMQREVLGREQSKASAGKRRAFSSMIPLGEVGTEEDVAPVLLFLLSDAAKYITGQIIAVDGGVCPVR